MKKVLYISNIEVPYRVEFFNQLAKKCNLTVLYERNKSKNRDVKWTSSIEKKYNVKYLNVIKIKNENSFNLSIIKYIFGKYDKIIFGCYNSPVQMFAILLMKLFRKSYILNLDGEVFVKSFGIKNKLKKFFIKGAKAYLVAGEKSAESIRKITKCKEIYTYYFSSLTEKELEENNKHINKNKEDRILVIGQYFDYKGLDIAAEVAKKNKNLKYKFIGMGQRSELFKKNINSENIEIIPFLPKEDLYEEYQKCRLVVLPSRQECWGLVINEATSFGVPIVSTWGSGAAIEFMGDEYSEFIAETCNPEDLYKKINNLINYEQIDEYKNYLIGKSKRYNIEHAVRKHLELINKEW